MLDFPALAAVARHAPAAPGADQAQTWLAAHGFHPAAVLALIAAGRLEKAEDACDAAPGGDSALALRALARVRLGRARSGEADARRVVAGGDPFAIAALADALLERSAPADAERWLALAGPSPRWPEHLGHSFLLDTLARVRLAQRRAPEALKLARECARRQRALNVRNPGVVAWGSTLAAAAAATGRTGEALDAADEQLDLARAFGVARPQRLALNVLAQITGAAA
ncbi:MAG TPA: hypothetical protein VNS09_08895 [Solirubrobacter sp.]|nr:hypothetical protein [Solirubrobacter sp.]